MRDERNATTTNITEALSFDEMAALLARLDGAVVVDSAIAHVAASLGVRTCMLASRTADWRWERFEQYSRWYPALTLFRQSRLGDWTSAVQGVADAIRAG